MRSDLRTHLTRPHASSGRRVGSALAVAVAAGLLCVSLVAGSSTAAGTSAARQGSFQSSDGAGPSRARSTSSVRRAVRAVGVASRLTVGAVGPASITLRWKPSSDPNVQRYRVLLNGHRSLTTVASKATVRALSCGTAYQVGVAAVDRSGGTSRSLSLTTATRACEDRTKPSAPGSIVVLARATDAIVVSWASATDNIGVVRYDVFLKAKKVGSTATNSFGFPNLTCNQSYSIGVRAVDGAGNVSATTTTLVSTVPCPAAAVPPPDAPPPAGPAADTTAPSEPALSIAATATDSITMAWAAASDNVGVTGYSVYQGSSRIATTSALTRTLTQLACGAAYTIGVEAYDAAGNTSRRATVVASTRPCTDSSPPTSPSGLGVVASNETSASLSWNPSTDNVGVVGYGVYRGGLLVDEVSNSAFVLTGLTCNTTYSIGVDAVDGSANRSSSTTAFFTTAACQDTTAPTAPTGLGTTAASSSSLTTSWSAATDNVAVAGYGVYLNGTRLTSQGALSYAFGSLTCGTAYTVGVDAYDAAGNRSAKSTLAATTGSCPSQPPPSSANLVVSTSGNDSTCARNNASATCASLGGAYAKAQGGDLVEVAGGTYGGQSLSPRSLGSSDVRFRAATGASVTLGGLSVNTSHVDIQGLRVDGGMAVQKIPPRARGRRS